MPFLENNLILNKCPHCGVDKPNIVSVQIFATADYAGQNQRFWRAYKCNRCGGAIIAGSEQSQGGYITEIHPNEIVVNECLPEKAKAFLNQAINSLHAPSGAIMLAASSIDAMLKNKGYEDGVLYTRIKKATEDHLITEGMSKWAHEVRLDANEERHADTAAALPNYDDAKRTVDFALALAELLYVLPSKVERGIKDATETDEEKK